MNTKPRVKVTNHTVKTRVFRNVTQGFGTGLIIWNEKKNGHEIWINAGNWVVSAQDRNYWRALVNAALNLRIQ